MNTFFRSFISASTFMLLMPACKQPDKSNAIIPDASNLPDSVIAGKNIFEISCVRCHGMDAGGITGPSLKRSKLAHAPDLAAFTQVVEFGINGTGMPAHWDLTDADCSKLYAYISYLKNEGMETPSGDTAAGRLVYTKSICANCHMNSGEGNSIGPELSQIGTSRSPAYLKQAIIDPGAALPGSTDPLNGYGFSLYLPVKVVTTDGTTITGLRINEDTYTIQMKDLSNNYYSFNKDDLQSLEKNYDTSLMPSFKNVLTDKEIENLVAYLYKLGN
ncbi:MAG: c-type cytochrome [Panacibacter sp.]